MEKTICIVAIHSVNVVAELMKHEMEYFSFLAQRQR